MMRADISFFVSQSQLEPRRAWTRYWSRPLRTLQTHASNPVRGIRAQALGSLQRVLLSTSLFSLPSHTPEAIKAKATGIDAPWLFTHSLFPLLLHLPSFRQSRQPVRVRDSCWDPGRRR